MAKTLSPGIYRMTDGTDPQRTWDIVVLADGSLGSIAGNFEKKDIPPLGVHYVHEDISSVVIQFHADGSYGLVKPGPDSTGTWAQLS